MIELTRPNKEIIFLNPFVIESLERTNHTLLTLTNGKKYMVEEPVEEITIRIFQWWEGVFKLKNRMDFIDNLTKKEQ